MKNSNLTGYALALSISALLVVTFGCAQKEVKIPVTTASEEALQLFLQGRDLAERLQGQESLQFFEQAVEKDPDFALGYLFLSFAQPSAKGFFENLDKAKALVDKVSEGERLWILGIEAGVNGFPMKQREFYQKLVEAYPNDERARNLLGINYFGQQEWESAVGEFRKATEIAPDFSQPYNMMGYAFRSLENYTEAEKAFKKYIELIPNDPNPYDSYAELLMKMGKYDASIVSYRKALEQNPNFVASFIGIATNLNFKGNHRDARKELQKLYDIARNDGERRAALFAIAVSCADEGDLTMALQMIEKILAIDKELNDPAAMAQDLVNMGNIYLEMGDFENARLMFKSAVMKTADSDLSEEVKQNTHRGYLFNYGRVALKRENIEEAVKMAEDYMTKAEEANNPLQIKLAHQLMGMIALEEKDYDKALGELLQANQQNPYNLYRMALAYQGKGDTAKAKEFCMKAAQFNALNSLNQAFIRSKAQQMAESM